MSRFVENPNFWVQFTAELGRALEDKAADIKAVAQRNTTHPSVARTIVYEGGGRDARGAYAIVRHKKGLGPIFEKGATNRHTKAGAYRGSITAERHLERALDSEVPKGLDLSLYL